MSDESALDWLRGFPVPYRYAGHVLYLLGYVHAPDRVNPWDPRGVCIHKDDTCHPGYAPVFATPEHVAREAARLGMPLVPRDQPVVDLDLAERWRKQDPPTDVPALLLRQAIDFYGCLDRDCRGPHEEDAYEQFLGTVYEKLLASSSPEPKADVTATAPREWRPEELKWLRELLESGFQRFRWLVLRLQEFEDPDEFLAPDLDPSAEPEEG